MPFIKKDQVLLKQKKIKKEKKIKKRNLRSKKNFYSAKILISIGFLFIFIGFFIILLTFYPVIKEEVRYQQIKGGKNRQNWGQIKPVDKNFGIIIPKINANSKIIANVNPFDEKIYQKALTQGVAHAQGSALPEEVGNVFLFSHSSMDWYLANRYNSVFYLLNKLEKNDLIIIYYQNKKYLYQVSEKKIVPAEAIKYLYHKPAQRTLTLMTCWPPGTNLRRLIIIAKKI